MPSAVDQPPLLYNVPFTLYIYPGSLLELYSALNPPFAVPVSCYTSLYDATYISALGPPIAYVAFVLSK